MNEKRINIDVEVIKKPKIYELCCVEASVYEQILPETVTKSSKWQNFKNKIIRNKNLRKR